MANPSDGLAIVSSPKNPLGAGDQLRVRLNGAHSSQHLVAAAAPVALWEMPKALCVNGAVPMEGAMFESVATAELRWMKVAATGDEPGTMFNETAVPVTKTDSGAMLGPVIAVQAPAFGRLFFLDRKGNPVARSGWLRIDP